MTKPLEPVEDEVQPPYKLDGAVGSLESEILLLQSEAVDVDVLDRSSPSRSA
jgi:hypothetical protein